MSLLSRRSPKMWKYNTSKIFPVLSSSTFIMATVFVLYLGLLVHGQDVKSSSAFPRYDMTPERFMYTVRYPPTDLRTATMEFAILVPNQQQPNPTFTFEDCYTDMDYTGAWGPPPPATPIPVQLTAGQRLRIEFTTIETSVQKNGVRLNCARMTINTQKGNIHTPTKLVISSSVQVGTTKYVPPDITRVLSSTKSYMTHEFRWNHGTGVNNGLLGVDYTLYLPHMSIVDHGPTFSLHHRLLSRENIDSIHPPSNGDRQLDYARLYQLIGLNEDVKCITMTSSDEINGAKITYNNGGEYPYVSLPNPSSITDGIICTFTIQYTPEQLYDIFTYGDADKYRNVLIHYGSDVSYAAQPLTAPSTIPLRKGADHTAASNRAHVWMSPHHRHYHNDFEFGLVVMTTYIDDNGDIQQINGQSGEGFLENFFRSYPSKNIPYTIECYRHSSNIKDQPPDIIFSHEDQASIPLGAPFDGFGLTCRGVFLNSETPDTIDAVLFRLTTSNTNLSSIKVYDSMNRLVPTPNTFPLVSNENTGETFIGLPYRAITLDDNHLSPPHRLAVQFSPATIDEIEVNYATITMTIQYLSHIPSDARRDQFYLHLLCHQLPQFSTLLQSESGNVPAVITISYGDHIILHNAPIAYTLFDPTIDIDVSPVDISHSFVYDRPIRIPSIIIPITARLVSAKPVNVSIRFQLMDGVDTTSFSDVYAVLLVNHLSQMQVYSAGIARIRPMVTTSPSNYSYRCVEWENMITAYTPYTMALNGDTSKPCPPFVPETDGTEGGDAEPDSSPFWRTIKYMQVTTDNESPTTPICYHELSAVCVTPSTQREGEYDGHPIEQCESLLGSTHLIPCDAVESSELRPLSAWGYSLSNMEASLLDDKLALTWSYSGDPRLSMSLDMVYILEDDTTSHPPIRIARNIPAGVFSALANEATQQPTLVVNFPLFYDVAGKSVLLQLTLNGFHTISTEVTLDLQSTSSEECTGSDQYKMVDPNTHLCVCKPGYAANVPIGTDNPFVHPTGFTCTLRSQCAAGTEWDPDAARCTCPQNGSYDQHCNPLPPQEAATCDVIPPGLVAPFKTTSCHYGIATDGNCQQCTCFKAWSIDNTTKKCDHCRLRDTCHKDNTHDITYLDQYCWVGRCLCKPGFYGTTCQHRVVYGTLQYVNPSTDDEKMSNASQKSPIILSRKEIQSFETRITGNVMALFGDTPVRTFVHQATQVLSDDKEQMVTSLVIGFGRLDKFVQSDSDDDGDGNDNNDDNDGQNDNNMPFIQLSTETENPHDLYHAWEQLQNAYDHQPINNDEQFGDMENIGEAIDPNCVPNPSFSCPTGENNLLPPQSQVDDDELVDVPDLTLGGESSSDNTTTYIIIGVVLGVILLLFALLIIMILYCRKHSKMCFRKKRTKRDATKKSMDGDDNGTAKSANDGVEMTHSAPTATISTSSYLPTQVPIEDATLPPDWVALRDQNTGKVYYSNKVTMQSSWDHPAQPKAEKSAYGW